MQATATAADLTVPHAREHSQAENVQGNIDDLLGSQSATNVQSPLASIAAEQPGGMSAVSQSVFDANELDIPTDGTGAEVSDVGQQTLVGIVTSGVVRGVSGSIGAVGLCSLAALQQAQLQQHGNDAGDKSKASHGFAMQMQCPLSKALRNVTVYVQQHCA